MLDNERRNWDKKHVTRQLTNQMPANYIKDKTTLHHVLACLRETDRNKLNNSQQINVSREQELGMNCSCIHLCVCQLVWRCQTISTLVPWRCFDSRYTYRLNCHSSRWTCVSRFPSTRSLSTHILFYTIPPRPAQIGEGTAVKEEQWKESIPRVVIGAEFSWSDPVTNQC